MIIYICLVLASRSPVTVLASTCLLLTIAYWTYRLARMYCSCKAMLK